MNDCCHQSRLAVHLVTHHQNEAAASSWDVLNKRSSPTITLRNLSSLLSLLSQLLASNSSERPFPRGTAIKALGVFLLPVVVCLFESLNNRTSQSWQLNDQLSQFLSRVVQKYKVYLIERHFLLFRC